ncbi:hypothetical protein EYZ11_004247 [Aspergillus tanneri]|uniref:Uncharacterized protein n=1 Tax=Aspergillus tanneri TaxID=1220188 RepID=A0A4V3UPS3_9EURO|nr:hypothetical protein EYZ11_004247 [Aspergillus tanneri]
MACEKSAIVIVVPYLLGTQTCVREHPNLNEAPVIHPSLPSISDVDCDDFPTLTLTDDAIAGTQALVEERKSIVVVMHSSRGIVGSEAITQSLISAACKIKGVLFHLFYYSAFIHGKGSSALGTFGEFPNKDVRVHGRSDLR